MSQSTVKTWTNPNPAVARNLDVGFHVDEVTIVDKTNGGSWYWNSGMDDASVLDVDAGTISATNGVTPLSQGAMFGAAMSNFTTANPGVITATNISTFGFEAGDTIEVSAVAESGAGTSKNGTFTVASVTTTTITLNESTVGYKTYVSGGYVSRVSDADGNPIPTENKAIQGVTLGTSAVGAASAAMTAVFRGAMPVT
jgi:hypothetical protein